MLAHPDIRPAYQPDAIALAACAFAITTGGEIQLTPAGAFRSRDGRPAECDAWIVNDETAPALLDTLRAKADRLVIDYDHATLHTNTHGQKAPAAGWFSGADVVYRSGEGLFVVPEWTEAAAAHIERDEYKYFSPVLLYNSRTGVVVDIVMGAICNYAAIDGMQQINRRQGDDLNDFNDLHALAAAKFHIQTTNHPEKKPMLLQQIRALLDLDETADEAAALSAVTALKQSADNAETAIAAAKAEVPGDTLSTMQNLQNQVAELTGKIESKELDDLVETALKGGTLLPAQEDWARKLGKTDLAALKGYLGTVNPVAALKGNQTGGTAPEGHDKGQLDADALKVCELMGVNPDDYLKTQNEDKSK